MSSELDACAAQVIHQKEEITRKDDIIKNREDEILALQLNFKDHPLPHVSNASGVDDCHTNDPSADQGRDLSTDGSVIVVGNSGSYADATARPAAPQQPANATNGK